MSATPDIMHDKHLYDPDRHDNQLVAVFEGNAEADSARRALIAAGIPEDAVRVAAAPDEEATETSTGDQILSAFMSLFASEHHDYAHAAKHGHAMVIITPNAAVDRHRAIEVLESCHPIDFDAKLEEWRQAGYEGADTPQEATSGREWRSDGPGARVRSYIADRS